MSKVSRVKKIVIGKALATCVALSRFFSYFSYILATLLFTS